jgi:hypothetical protein
MTDKILVIVKWNDANGDSLTAYAAQDVPHVPIVIDTVGWLMRDDDNGVSVSGEFCGDDTWRSVTFVPRGMVISVTPVKRARKKKEPVCLT